MGPFLLGIIERHVIFKVGMHYMPTKTDPHNFYGDINNLKRRVMKPSYLSDCN